MFKTKVKKVLFGSMIFGLLLGSMATANACKSGDRLCRNSKCSPYGTACPSDVSMMGCTARQHSNGRCLVHR